MKTTSRMLIQCQKQVNFLFQNKRLVFQQGNPEKAVEAKPTTESLQAQIGDLEGKGIKIPPEYKKVLDDMVKNADKPFIPSWQKTAKGEIADGDTTTNGEQAKRFLDTWGDREIIRMELVKPQYAKFLTVPTQQAMYKSVVEDHAFGPEVYGLSGNKAMNTTNLLKDMLSLYVNIQAAMPKGKEDKISSTLPLSRLTDQEVKKLLDTPAGSSFTGLGVTMDALKWINNNNDRNRLIDQFYGKDVAVLGGKAAQSQNEMKKFDLEKAKFYRDMEPEQALSMLKTIQSETKIRQERKEREAAEAEIDKKLDDLDKKVQKK